MSEISIFFRRTCFEIYIYVVCPFFSAISILPIVLELLTQTTTQVSQSNVLLFRVPRVTSYRFVRMEI
ncbi:hypothetical protein L2E82_02792 [Cichorium intybus]|uniref:Uncharacterized protein n=1 Tax=Cichorium intybus TaxID=13427 RepID=A0ACB9H2B1_CICIN|nr:hypothetical protein L2E82_02792 [Cichorium intybus]